MANGVKHYWDVKKNEIFDALELFDEVLEEYDEDYGLAGYDTLLEELEDIRKFMTQLCCPGEK